MSLEVIETQVPSLITWFNGFVGFRDLQKRVEQVEQKLKSIGFASPVLNKRYSFHTTYMTLAVRNRMQRKINLRELQNIRWLSLIAAIREVNQLSSEKGKNALRSRVRDALSPDQDIRTLEHEMRAFVHYRQAGYPVQFPELEGAGRFDLLISGPKGDFEVECKTFSENIGYPITVEDSLAIFRLFKTALSHRDITESGILTLTMDDKFWPLSSELAKALDEFIEVSPSSKHYGGFNLKFERKDDWTIWSRDGNVDRVISEIQSHYESLNPHSLIAISKKRSVMFCITSAKRPKPALGMISRLKEASKQLSETRAGVIWAHLLAINEAEFAELSKRGAADGRKPFDVFAQSIFRSSNRNHVCRLRFSVDSDSVSTNGYRYFLRKRSPVMSLSGPAYDLTSGVSVFDPLITEA